MLPGYISQISSECKDEHERIQSLQDKVNSEKGSVLSIWAELIISVRKNYLNTSSFNLIIIIAKQTNTSSNLRFLDKYIDHTNDIFIFITAYI